MIMGGNGALGRAMVNAFKASSWKVLSVDLANNSQADANLLVNPNEKVQDQLKGIYSQVSQFSKEFDSIICVAGGFGLSSIKDEDVLEKFL